MCFLDIKSSLVKEERCIPPLQTLLLNYIYLHYTLIRFSFYFILIYFIFILMQTAERMRGVTTSGVVFQLIWDIPNLVSTVNASYFRSLRSTCKLNQGCPKIYCCTITINVKILDILSAFSIDNLRHIGILLKKLWF